MLIDSKLPIILYKFIPGDSEAIRTNKTYCFYFFCIACFITRGLYFWQLNSVELFCNLLFTTSSDFIKLCKCWCILESNLIIEAFIFGHFFGHFICHFNRVYSFSCLSRCRFCRYKFDCKFYFPFVFITERKLGDLLFLLHCKVNFRAFRTQLWEFKYNGIEWITTGIVLVCLLIHYSTIWIRIVPNTDDIGMRMKQFFLCWNIRWYLNFGQPYFWRINSTLNLNCHRSNYILIYIWQILVCHTGCLVSGIG